MKKGHSFRMIAALCLFAVLLTLCIACGANGIDPTGTYTFDEVYSGSSGGADFSTRNWVVEFAEDGGYTYTYEETTSSGGWFGPKETTTTRFRFFGTYTAVGDTVQCAAPISGTSQIISVMDGDGNPVEEDPAAPRTEQEVEVFLTLTNSFFNDDQSCDWTLDKDAGTITPVKYREPISNRDNNSGE